MEQETSRRGFLGASGIALAGARLSAYQQRPRDKQLFAYVGRHTTGGFSGPPGKEGGINVFRVNMSDGSLTEARGVLPGGKLNVVHGYVAMRGEKGRQISRNCGIGRIGQPELLEARTASRGPGV